MIFIDQLECHFTCLNCVDGRKNSCIDCSLFDSREYIQDDSLCKCISGFFAEPDDEKRIGKCYGCHKSCLTCFGPFKIHCMSCFPMEEQMRLI